MICLNPTIENDTVAFSMEECARSGRALREKYVNAKPFPSIVIDDFLPTPVLRRVIDEFPSRKKGRFADAQSNLKTGYQLEMIQSRFITSLLYALNSAQMLTFMGNLTGIEGLIPDPYYRGGGLHETAKGGHLSIHADFNIYPTLKLIRRVNIIVFLNEGWCEEYGGHLELWDKDMTAAQTRVLPVMGRAVAFNTDRYSYHGHPDPLQVPEGSYRRSIALYYYTAPTKNLDTYRTYSTQFQIRPRSNDRRDYSTYLGEMVRDVCPPLLWRLLARQ
ncbi:MAG: 2OG-Fe(II) oxygenase [Nitrososphaera sp.]|nr:2OG-Fe(II) oxygenase [Nitrososphaera sp.]